MKLIFKFALTTFIVAVVMTATAPPAQAAACGCTARPISKTYQEFERHKLFGQYTYAITRKWSCEYDCTGSYGNQETVVGYHSMKSYGDDDGTEGVCDGIAFVSHYHPDLNREIHFPENDKPQFIQLGWGARFSPSSPELKNWLKQNCAD